MDIHTYETGQVWTYQTRPGEEASRLIIARIDEDPVNETIFHIFLLNVSIRNPNAPSGTQEVLPHSPVTCQSLDESVVDLIGNLGEDVPDIAQNYAVWKEAFDRGEGGVFTIPVAQVVQVVDDVINGNVGS